MLANYVAIQGLKAAFLLANNGQLDDAIRAEAARTGRPLQFDKMSDADCTAWLKWLNKQRRTRNHGSH